MAKKLKITNEQRQRRPLISVMFCIACILINICGSAIAGTFGLPVFLDSVGTVLAAVLGGYLPGIAVGYLTNIINGFGDITNAYYGIISVFIAIAAAAFAKKGYFGSFGKCVIAVIVLALIGGGLGSMLTYYLYGQGIGEGISVTMSSVFYRDAVHNIFWAQLLADMIIDIIDKAVTVAISVAAVRFIPERYKALVNISFDSGESSRRIGKKMLTAICVSALFVTAAAAGTCVLLYQRASMQENTAVCRTVASFAAAEIDAERVDEYMELGRDAGGYDETEEKLVSIMNNSDNVKYMYVYRIEEDGCHVVFDLDGTDMNEAPLPGDEPGSVIPFDKSFEKYVPSLLAGEEMPPIISKDKYGWLLTVYQPVYKSDGSCACYVGADVSMQHMSRGVVSFAAECTSLILAFMIFISAVIVWIAKYRL